MIKQYRLSVEVEPLEEGGYFAPCPGLEGCHAEGVTIAGALDNVEDVARMIIELSMEKGLSVLPNLPILSPRRAGELERGGPALGALYLQQANLVSVRSAELLLTVGAPI